MPEGLGSIAGITVTGTAEGAKPQLRGTQLSIVSDDGETRVNIGPPPEREDNFDENLAETLPDSVLGAIATQLLTDIQMDEQSRSQWLATRTRGLGLLGLELLEPRSDVGSSASPLEGMSTITSPLLLSEVLRAQATARGELLPADGPVKVLDESCYGTAERDELADNLEKDLNSYLTTVCTEYYPDTDRMLFYWAFGGSGFKKVYHCPLRRRPVSESVDASDLIVDSNATDLANARRITHVIHMRESMVKRMMALEAYREVTLGQAQQQPNTVQQKEAQISGVDINQVQPQDQDRTIYEVCCEWPLGVADEKRPKDLPEDIALPYRITIDKDARVVLSMRRNWRKDDALGMPRRLFVRYPYVDAVGIYGIGLLQILGNTQRGLTAAEREMLDAGMFANFPGFLYGDTVARQDTNEFRVPPGGGMKINTNGQPIKENIMPLPYKDITPTLLAFAEKVYARAKELAGSAEIPIAEGLANAPVGTVLALLEQATRVMSAVHKRAHAAQAEEFQLLKERLKEDPEAFWEHGKRLVYKWDKETFLKALDAFELVPVADPNMPTQTHRLLKATGVKLLQKDNPAMYDAKAIDSHILRMIGFSNPDQFFAKVPAQMPPNPAEIMAQAKIKEAAMREAGKEKSDQAKIVMERLRAQSDALQAARQHQIEQEKAAIQRQRIGADLAIEGMEHKSVEEMNHERAESGIQSQG